MNAHISYKNVTVRKISVSEGIDIDKTNASKECSFVIFGILKMLHFDLNHMFVTNVMMFLMTTYELKNIAIIAVKGVDFRCILWGISKDEAANRLHKSV